MEGFGYILASASPRRKELLKKILKDFEVIPSDAEETIPSGISPVDVAIENALRKAVDVSDKYPDAIVIGADTIVILDEIIMGKPKDLKEATIMLESLSGKTHQVITGVAVAYAAFDVQITDFGFTDVTFKKLDSAIIEEYVNKRKPLDMAGAYGIQEIQDMFVESVEYDFNNVVGLPLNVTAKLLELIIQRTWG